MRPNIKNNYAKLYEVLLQLKSEEDCKNLMNDLCTERELNAMTQRIMAAKMLLSGATYESVIKETNVSSATLSRVSRCVKNGKGYKKFIDISK